MQKYSSASFHSSSSRAISCSVSDFIKWRSHKNVHFDCIITILNSLWVQLFSESCCDKIWGGVWHWNVALCYAGAFLSQRKLLNVSIDANFLWLKVQCDAPSSVLSFCELFRSWEYVCLQYLTWMLIMWANHYRGAAQGDFMFCPFSKRRWKSGYKFS